MMGNGNIAQYIIDALSQQQGGGGMAQLPNFQLPQRMTGSSNDLLQYIDQLDREPVTMTPPMQQSMALPQQSSMPQSSLLQPIEVGRRQLPVGGPQTPAVPTKNVSTYIQEALGAKEPTSGDFLQSILSRNNTGPSFDDYSRAIQKSAYDTPTGAQDYADANLKQKFEQIAVLQKLQANGGATGELVNRLMQEDPNLSFKDALYQVQTGFRQGTQLDADGNIILTPGRLQTLTDTEKAKKYGSETGGNLATNQNNLPSTLTSAQLAIDTIDNALNHPGFDANFGIKGQLYNIPGGDAADAKTYIDQIGGQNFLTAYQTLKGGGQITEIEGQKAEAAMARLAKAQSAASARQALNELKSVVRTGMTNALIKAGNQAPASNGPDLNDPGFQEFLRSKGLVQ